MTSEWNHLPNAHHIDRILASMKSHHEVWMEFSTPWNLGLPFKHDAEIPEGYLATRAAEDKMSEALPSTKNNIFYAAYKATMMAAGYPEDPDNTATLHWQDQLFNRALNGITALITWDDSSKLLAITADEIKAWYTFTEEPAAILLLPVVQVFEKIQAKS